MDRLRIVSISFHTAGKIFDFDTQGLELAPGNKVIVETERGRALGTVVTKPRDIDPKDAPPKLKAVMRIANESDMQMAASNAQREQEALKFCQQRVMERKLDMKLVRAEYLFDGSKIVFYFTADGRIDFRELVRDLAQYFRTRIEMRQIGVRDEAKLIGGLGICGRELCCCSHLREFAPVSVKMAKAQGLALNPTKISGQCGRLLCCLAYEYETYNEMRKALPKCGKKLQISSGPAEVVALDILAQKVTLACQSGERCQLHISELQAELEGKPEIKTERPAGTKDKVLATEAPPPESVPSKSTRRTGGPERKSRDKHPVAEKEVAKPEEAAKNKSSSRRRRRPRRRPKKPDTQA